MQAVIFRPDHWAQIVADQPEIARLVTGLSVEVAADEPESQLISRWAGLMAHTTRKSELPPHLPWKVITW